MGSRHFIFALIAVLAGGLFFGCHAGAKRVTLLQSVKIGAVVRKEMRAGQFPGAVVLVGQGDRILYRKAFGYAVKEPYQLKLREDAVFDLASLTKPIATATAAMILIERGRLALDDEVAKYLPAFACKGKERVRIEHLLTHTSGLPAYTSAAPLEKRYGAPWPEKVVEKICSLKALNQPGETFRYSCLGYITLGRIVEIVSGQSLADFTAENIFTPLEMRRTAFDPPLAWRREIAATTLDHRLPRRGTVHDPLARLMGGVSGNAGLFSTADDLARYCRMLLNAGSLEGARIFSPAAVSLLTAEQSHGRAYGFDVNSGYAWIKGARASRRAFCHSGYTGTSVVCDPLSGRYLIILTNRAHPADKGTTKPLRTRLADIVF